MKIIFMPSLPLIKRDYIGLGIEYFYTRGYDVSVLETHQLLLQGYKNKVDIEYFRFENTYEPPSIKDLLDIISELTEEDNIMYYLASKDAVQLLNKMKIHTKAKFITYISGSIPATSAPCGFKNKIKSFLRPMIKKYIDVTFDSDIVVTGAPKDELIFPFLFGKNTKKLHFHSRDYELCINTQDFVYDKEYCVFLDTDAINASDYIIFGTESEKKIKEYQDKLITFFKWIEKTINIVVIISAHPKSRIFKDTNNFRGFKVVHNQSESLVKNSKFVLNEGTTAISFAVYFEKPLLFFQMEELNFFYNTTCSYAKQFDKKIIYIDDIATIDIDDIYANINNIDKYKEFKYNFLTYYDTKSPVYELIEKELFIGR